MKLMRQLGQSVYTGIWTYAISDTLFPSYLYFTYSPYNGLVRSSKKTAISDIQLLNNHAFYLSIGAALFAFIILTLKQLREQKRLRENRRMIGSMFGHTKPNS